MVKKFKSIVKIAVLCFSISLLSFLHSCAPDKIDDNQTSKPIDEDKISQVISERNIDTQKSMYGMLTKEEKYALWNTKLDYLIENGNKGYLNTEQLNLINDLKRHSTLSLFDDKVQNDEWEIFKNMYLKGFLERANGLFSYQFIHQTFYTTNNVDFSATAIIKPFYEEPYIIAPPAGGKGPIYPCRCAAGSLYDCSSTSCIKTSGCDPSPNKCGFYQKFTCNGMCSL